MSTAINTSAPASSRVSSTTWNDASPNTSGHHHHHHDAGPSSATAGKKGKQKKPADPVDNHDAVQARIAQLELDNAGEKAQEAEIGWFSHYGTALGEEMKAG